MEIKASDVAKLRQMTGSGMMDCKNALVEANGDFERAQEIIREKGKLVASKRADRETHEGSVIAKVSGDATKGVLVCLSCETDFVAKTAEFKALAEQVADAALANLPADVNALMDAKIGNFTIGELVSQQTGKTGEKHQIPCYEKLEGAQLIAYNHVTSGKDSALVALNKVLDPQIGKDIAMQITAMKPVSVSQTDCPQEVIDKEIKIAKEQMKLDPKMAGKPDTMLENIAKGKLNKFFKESTLLAQDFIKDGSMTVEAYLKNADKDATVTAFRRFSLND